MQFYSDRSRATTYRQCPRKYYYGYVQPTDGPVPGIRPIRVDMNLIVGGTFHEGVNHLLTGSSMDEAVGRAMEGHDKWMGYWPVVKEFGLSLNPEEDASYMAWEQASLAEALIRSYGYFMLPQLLERFTVVEAERDESALFTLDGFELLWGMRGDALLMDKEDLNLYILSLKTKKEWYGKKDEQKSRYDMQGLSESATVDQRLGRWHDQLDKAKAGAGPGPGTLEIPQWFVDRYIAGASPIVSGVKMEFALKGRRSEYPKGSGRWTFSNPLIRPWRKSEDLGRDQYAFMYEFKDEMGGGHRLGKGWNRINIWEQGQMGVKAWIDYLASNSIQGFDPGRGLAEQFIAPMEYFRNEEDMLVWQRQRLYEERRIAKGIEETAAVRGTSAFEEKLDEHFPMFGDFPSDCTYCEYEKVCRSGVKSYIYNPMSSGLYTIRTSNHEAENHVDLGIIGLPADADSTGTPS